MGAWGWRSLWVVWRYIRWSLESAYHGVFPRLPAPKFEWLEERASWGGLALSFRAVVMYVKCDMLEKSTSFGFPTWSSTDYPCTDCTCDLRTMYKPQPAGMLELQHLETTVDDWERACRQCEIEVLIDRLQVLLEVRSSLGRDGRAKSGKGRHMKRDMPSLGLLLGDRLEPSDAILDLDVIRRFQKHRFRF